MADTLKDALSKLSDSFKAISNSVSAANFAVQHRVKRSFAKFLKANEHSGNYEHNDYNDLVSDFLKSPSGKVYIDWFNRSMYNSDNGKMKLVQEAKKYV